ncbi:hypothetical protein KKF05_01585 [Patescibacteria group bacterium]|nr:hypothetical protein [Patescibacteria group bacterium]MBU1028616.1 hypothetical protein [Patescibacteria group bacterium]MBU1915618.1 hypothetical protein [Patescibacteria group bacterium]
MRSFQKDETSDVWSFEVVCRHCKQVQVIDEKDLFMTKLQDVPIPLPGFFCGTCQKSCILSTGNMPIHVYDRLEKTAPRK